MIDIKIRESKILKIGNSYGIIIPLLYVKNGIVDTEKKYDVILREADTDE